MNPKIFMSVAAVVATRKHGFSDTENAKEAVNKLTHFFKSMETFREESIEKMPKMAEKLIENQINREGKLTAPAVERSFTAVRDQFKAAFTEHTAGIEENGTDVLKEALGPLAGLFGAEMIFNQDIKEMLVLELSQGLHNRFQYNFEAKLGGIKGSEGLRSPKHARDTIVKTVVATARELEIPLETNSVRSALTEMFKKGPFKNNLMTAFSFDIAEAVGRAMKGLIEPEATRLSEDRVNKLIKSLGKTSPEL